MSSKDVYKESEDYQEIQFTLRASGHKTFYLIRSEERKVSGSEVVWVFTQRISLSKLKYEVSPQDWRAFQENKFVSSPPQTILMDDPTGTRLTFCSETSVRAKDDEGLTVTKITWDYYDASGLRNIAIEIWKENDGDYPEAYDGTVVQPSEFEILSEEVRKTVVHKIKPFEAQAFWGSVGAVILFSAILCLAGLPFDCALAAAVPVISVIFIFQRSSYFGWFIFLLTALPLGGVLVLGHGFFTSFGRVTFLAIIISVAAPKAIAAIKPDAVEEGNPVLFAACLLPVLWIFSFFMYFKFAPGPHRAGQLFAACALPLVITALAFFIHRVSRYATK